MTKESFIPAPANLMKPLALIIVCALMGVSCNKFLKERSFIEAIGSESLKAYAAEMQRNEVWIRLNGQAAPESLWLPDFSTNGVLQVKSYLSGVLIVLETQGRVERGIYVQADEAERPEDGSGINFAPIQRRIYWFEQKARVPYIPPEKRKAASQ